MFLKSTLKEQSKPASNESKSESKDNITIKEELKPEKNVATNSTDKKARKKESPHWAKGMFLKWCHCKLKVGTTWHWQCWLWIITKIIKYSSVPNRPVGWNNPVGGIFHGKLKLIGVQSNHGVEYFGGPAAPTHRFLHN